MRNRMTLLAFTSLLAAPLLILGACTGPATAIPAPTPTTELVYVVITPPPPTPDLQATVLAAVQATMVAMPTETPTPSPTPEPTQTPSPTPTPTTEPYDVWKSTVRTDLTFKLVDKSDEHEGQRVCWRGKIFNIGESLGITVFQAWYFEGRAYSLANDGSSAFVVVYPGTLPGIFEDDSVEACGTIIEKYVGTNTMGGTIVQPQIEAVYVTKYTPPPAPTAKPKPPTATPVVAQIGEQVSASHWLFTVTQVQYQKAVYLYDWSEVAMGTYCLVFLDIQNQAPGTTYFGELWWELRDSAGNSYEDDSATSYAAWQFGGKDTPWTNLNPGETAQIVIAFDVPQNARGLTLYSYNLRKPFVLLGDAW